MVHDVAHIMHAPLQLSTLAVQETRTHSGDNSAYDEIGSKSAGCGGGGGRRTLVFFFFGCCSCCCCGFFCSFCAASCRFLRGSLKSERKGPRTCNLGSRFQTTSPGTVSNSMYWTPHMQRARTEAIPPCCPRLSAPHTPNLSSEQDNRREPG